MRYEDVPYMTTSWKNAIRAKRRAAAKYYKDKSAHNWEVKQRCRNEATRQRRIAIKQYWKKKANELTTNSKEFFKTFKPFLGSKTCTNKQAEINLKVNGIVVSDQTTVAETLACHFATLADSIGGDRAQQSEKQLCNHISLARIRSNCQNEQASFPVAILNALDSSLHTRSFRVLRIDDRSLSFEGLSTYICTVLLIGALRFFFQVCLCHLLTNRSFSFLFFSTGLMKFSWAK